MERFRGCARLKVCKLRMYANLEGAQACETEFAQVRARNGAEGSQNQSFHGLAGTEAMRRMGITVWNLRTTRTTSKE